EWCSLWSGGGGAGLVGAVILICFFFSSRRRHTRFSRDWSSDVCSSDLGGVIQVIGGAVGEADVALGVDVVQRVPPRFLRVAHVEDRKSGRVGKECTAGAVGRA